MTNRIRSSGTALVFLVSLVTLTSPFDPTGNAKATQDRTSLTFADRVAYQYAIEEVYWRHRIWPKENPGAKPGLDAVMSRAQIEKKVQNYLRNSQFLTDQLRPITPDQLQSEMDRIAAHTKQLDVLRELFGALNNDPRVIAECLARPVLAERLLRDLHAQGKLDIGPVRSAMNSSSTMAAVVPMTCRLPAITSTPNTCFDNWVATSLPSSFGVPIGQYGHTAVWTGSEMIIWGGNNGPAYLGGGKYNPTTDSWSLVSTANEPVYRGAHTAVWTGTEMIIWGGHDPVPNVPVNSGGRYNPGTDSWAATSTNNAPEPRELHTAVWTGTEMIVWGGYNPAGYENTGGRYNPATDSWTATSFPFVDCSADGVCLLEGRYSHTAVWTGSEMIVWGGAGGNLGVLNDGGRYNPSSDSWTATNFNNAPDPRFYHTAVWTGSEMIVWGGDVCTPSCSLPNTGERYNPTTNSWSETSLASAPDGRVGHTAVWTGSEMIIWGGDTFDPTGGRYNPITDSWLATSTTNAPTARAAHTAVWSGSEMIVWGGYDLAGHALDTGGRYCGQPSPTLQSAGSRKTHGGAGTFDVNLPLTGTPGIECRSSGATHDYTMVVTFSGNVTVTGNPQAQVTLGSGCVGSSGTCTGNVTVSGSTVTIPLTNIANAQTINVRINGVNSVAADTPATDFTVPMGVLIGDTNGNRAVNAGDVAQTKGRLGQNVDATNFRSDANANGTINAGDVSIVKSNLGTGLP